jgi:hypothetical protein
LTYTIGICRIVALTISTGLTLASTRDRAAAALPRFELSASSRRPQRALHRRRQPREVRLQDVIVRAASQRLDRGLSPIVPETKMNGTSARSSRTMRSAESPSNCGIAKSDSTTVGSNSFAAAAEIGLGLHAPPVEREAAALQLAHRDLGVGEVVLDQQDSVRAHVHPSDSGRPLRLAGDSG